MAKKKKKHAAWRVVVIVLWAVLCLLFLFSRYGLESRGRSAPLMNTAGFSRAFRSVGDRMAELFDDLGRVPGRVMEDAVRVKEDVESVFAGGQTTEN